MLKKLEKMVENLSALFPAGNEPINTLEQIRRGVAPNFNLNSILINGFFALFILIAGIIVGKAVSFILKKTFLKFDLQKHMNPGFVDLTIVVIRWGIYILFLELALQNLKMAILTNLFGAALVTIPAFIASLIILATGFMIATYLKKIVRETQSKKADFFSQILFYFILYVFGGYALEIALITLPRETIGYVIIALSLSLPIAIAILFRNKEPRSINELPK